MIKVKQAACGHYVLADKEPNATSRGPVTRYHSYEVPTIWGVKLKETYGIQNEEDIPIVLCDACIYRLTHKT